MAKIRKNIYINRYFCACALKNLNGKRAFHYGNNLKTFIITETLQK